MKQKKVPLRKCVGCHEQKTKKQLIRVVKNNQDEIFIDVSGKANGRGAYICPDLECLKKAAKKDALSRALLKKIDSGIYTRLEQDLVDKQPEIDARKKEEDDDES